MECGVCQNAVYQRTFSVREMMFGYRDEFVYGECSRCGCLQIAEIPVHMEKYYPTNYYSFSQDPSQMPSDAIRTAVRKQLDFYFPANSLHPDAHILDVGCGAGFSIYALRELGFKHVLGIDVYIQGDIAYRNGARVIKCALSDVEPQWDVVMFNHSFEHMPDPLGTLRLVSKLLSKNGLCFIRMPVASSYAWHRYGVNWVQIDAPRHFFIHSLDSVRMLAEAANLYLAQIVYDSTDFQFWASEQYMHDIPLYSDRSLCVNPSNSLFSQWQIEHFKQWAQQLNTAGQGDQAAFYLAKV
jgi:SAM-dependent methyltransferase